MSKIISYFILTILSSLIVSADLGFAQDDSNISINVFIDEDIAEYPSSSVSMLNNTLKRLVSSSGYGSTNEYPRFILVPKIDIIDKQVAPTAPPMIAVTLDVTLFLGDGIDGILFENYNEQLKGVGKSEVQAYNMALKKLNPRDKEMVYFLSNGKDKIVSYFNDKCNNIIETSKNKAARGLFDEAIYDLLEVPQIAKECHTNTLKLALSLTKQKLEAKCQSSISNCKSYIARKEWDSAFNEIKNYTPNLKCYGEIVSLYEKIETEKCTTIVGEARSLYAQKNFMESAQKLASVSSTAPCIEDATALLETIKKELDEKDRREWLMEYEKYTRNQAMIEENNRVSNEIRRREMAYKENQGAEIRKMEIEAARAIGVAYGKNQPKKVTYNIKGW